MQGYDISVCLRCTNTISDFDYVFQITQNALTCTNILSPITDSELSHMFANTGPKIHDVNSMFLPVTVDGCYINCELVQNSCVVPDNLPAEIIFDQALGDPWQFQAKADVFAGYSYQVCMRCTSNLNNIFDKSMIISQDPIKCELESTTTNQVFLYSTLASKVIGFENFFTNTLSSIEPQCNLSCDLYDQTCGNIYSDNYLVFNSQ